MRGNCYGRDPRILSYPIQLHWMGWTASTHDLARYGWEISAIERQFDDSMQIAVKHSSHGREVRGVSDIINGHVFGRGISLNDRQRFDLSVRMKLAEQIRLDHIMSMEPRDWSAVDPRPTLSSPDIETLDDLCHFKKINVNAQEVFLKEASIQEILQLALEKQEPRQAQIRKEMIRRKEMEEFNRVDSEPHTELRLVA